MNISGFTDTKSFDKIQFPIIKTIMNSTLSGGGTIKSNKQKSKEDRINKLRKLKGKKPNIVLPDDEKIPGLIPVKPLPKTKN